MMVSGLMSKVDTSRTEIRNDIKESEVKTHAIISSIAEKVDQRFEATNAAMQELAEELKKPQSHGEQPAGADQPHRQELW